MKDKVRADWSTAILICRKCSKKIGGGFGAGGDRSLAKLLRSELGGGKGRKAPVGIVEVDCLKICPKRAVVVVNAARPKDWLLVAAGTPIATVIDRIGVDTVVPVAVQP